MLINNYHLYHSKPYNFPLCVFLCTIKYKRMMLLVTSGGCLGREKSLLLLRGLIAYSEWLLEDGEGCYYYDKKVPTILYSFIAKEYIVFSHSCLLIIYILFYPKKREKKKRDKERNI